MALYGTVPPIEDPGIPIELRPSASFSPLFGPNSLIRPVVFLVFIRGLRGDASGPLERPGTTRAAGVGGDDPCDEIMVICLMGDKWAILCEIMIDN